MPTWQRKNASFFFAMNYSGYVILAILFGPLWPLSMFAKAGLLGKIIVATWVALLIAGMNGSSTNVMGNNDSMSAIAGFLMWAYFIVSQIMTLVFFIDYCKSGDSLIEIIFIDSLLSEIKGLLWIFFIW